jgi:hypothetical protein
MATTFERDLNKKAFREDALVFLSEVSRIAADAGANVEVSEGNWPEAGSIMRLTLGSFWAEAQVIAPDPNGRSVEDSWAAWGLKFQTLMGAEPNPLFCHKGQWQFFDVPEWKEVESPTEFFQAHLPGAFRKRSMAAGEGGR